MIANRSIRIAVVGTGYLGQLHARMLAELPSVKLVAVVDSDRSRAEATASEVGTAAATDYRELFDLVDAVILAVPTKVHKCVAVPFLERGISVLVEKPIARSITEADEMISVASAQGAILAVGHTERYNPAVHEILSVVTDPRFIEVHRLGVFSSRSLDIDVVFDLMIHDLDIVLTLVGSEVTAVEAVGVPVLTDRVDIANARIRFASGCIANLTASRISRESVRKVRIFQPDAYLSLDYVSQEVEEWRLIRETGCDSRIEGGKRDVTYEEPLKREISDFVNSVRSGTRPGVSGEDGRRALALSQQVTDAMKRDKESFGN